MHKYLKRSAKKILYPNKIPCFWSKSNNWGDALNPYIIRKISGKEARYEQSDYSWKNLVIGSILDKADQYSTVWGTGMISQNSYPREKPFSITAVRGPLTRRQLVSQGIDCPEIYGDPALLLPRFYSPRKLSRSRIGIIPHYIDVAHPWLGNFSSNENVIIIDINSPIEDFVDKLTSCELIISSSLHGIICSDAYEVPSIWIQLSDNIIGNNFKFLDYYSSVGRNIDKPVIVNNDTHLEFVINHIKEYKIQIDLDELLNSCPFKEL